MDNENVATHTKECYSALRKSEITNLVHKLIKLGKSVLNKETQELSETQICLFLPILSS